MPDITSPLLRFNGMYGGAFQNGQLLFDVTEVSGTITRNRIEVAVPGTERTGYKPGRQAREGTLRVQKIDGRWEYKVHQIFTASLADRRADRDRVLGGGTSVFENTFSLHLRIDDPTTAGPEEIVLHDCQIWNLPIGFSIADEIMEREFQMTWETEDYLEIYQLNPDGTPYWLAKT
jgi:hypothetical protein